MSDAATFTGTRDVTVDVRSVTLRVTEGEYLLHSVFATGAEPGFTFGCAHSPVIRQAQTFDGHPRNTYQWIHPETAVDVMGHEPEDVFAITMTFAGATAYRYVLERYAASGMLLETVRDVRLSSTNPHDAWPERVDVSFA
jgi:hypothetical protein